MDSENPFHPTTDDTYLPSAFAGRRVAYSHINQHLTDNTTGQAAAFLGRRHIGKSALLWHFQEFFPEAYLGVYIPLRQFNGTLTTDHDLVDLMVSGLRRALADRNLPTDRIPPLPEAPPPTLASWLQATFAPAVVADLRGRRRVVFLIDDADVLLAGVRAGDISSGLFEALSQMMQTNPQLGMVLTLREEAEPDVDQLAPLTETTQIIRLSELTPEETALLVRIPNEYRLTDAATKQIYRATNGEPLLVQRVGAALYEQATPNPSPPTLTEQDVKSVLPTVVNQSHLQFRSQWQGFTLDERLVLSAISDLMYKQPLAPVSTEQITRWLVETDYPLDKITVQSATRGLVYKHVIHNREGGVVVASGILQAWLLQQARLNTGPGSVGRRWWVAVVAIVAMAALAALLIMAIQGGQFQRGSNTPSPVAPTVTLEAR